MSLPDPSSLKSKFSPNESYRDPLQLGMTIVGTTAAFGGIGWWLDSLLGIFPILMACGATFGLFGIIYLTYLRLRETDQNSENHPPSSGG